MADNPNEEELDLVEFEDSDGGTVTLKVERYFFYNGDEYVLLSNDIGSEPPEETVRYVMKVQPLPEEGEKLQAIVQKHEDGSEWRNVIRMTPEGFCMIESDCEGHDCIEEGEVTLDNMQDRLLWNMVICAPHRLTLYLYTPEEAAEQSRQWLGE